MRNWTKPALVLSLALNVLVVCAVVGGVIAHDRHGPMRPPDGGWALGPLGGAFSPEERAAIRREALAQGIDFAALRQDMRADMLALVAALQADPWDGGAVRTQLEAMHRRGDDRARLGEDLMLQHLAAMTVDERRQYAERLGRQMDRFAPAPRNGADAEEGAPPPRP